MLYKKKLNLTRCLSTSYLISAEILDLFSVFIAFTCISDVRSAHEKMWPKRDATQNVDGHEQEKHQSQYPDRRPLLRDPPELL